MYPREAHSLGYVREAVTVDKRIEATGELYESVESVRWTAPDGSTITDPDLIAKLEAARARKKGQS